MKWIRIIGNVGTAFFSTIGGLLTLEGLTGGAIPLDLLLPASFVVAGIQGALAFFREITEVSKEKNFKGFVSLCNGNKSKKINGFLNYTLLW